MWKCRFPVGYVRRATQGTPSRTSTHFVPSLRCAALYAVGNETLKPGAQPILTNNTPRRRWQWLVGPGARDNQQHGPEKMDALNQDRGGVPLLCGRGVRLEQLWCEARAWVAVAIAAGFRLFVFLLEPLRTSTEAPSRSQLLGVQLGLAAVVALRAPAAATWRQHGHGKDVATLAVFSLCNREAGEGGAYRSAAGNDAAATDTLVPLLLCLPSNRDSQRLDAAAVGVCLASIANLT